MRENAMLTSSQSSIVVVGLRIAGVVCQATAIVVLVNALSPREFGIFSALYIFWGLVRMLAPVGLDHIILRDVAAARATGDDLHAVALGRRGCRAASLGGLGLMVAAAPLIAAVNSATDGGLSVLEIALIAGAVPAFTVMGVLASVLRAFDCNVASQGIESLGLHLLVLFLFAIFGFLGGLDLDTALACMAVSAYVAIGVYALALMPLLRVAALPVSAEAWRDVRSQSFEVWQALLLIGLAGRAPNYISLVLLGPVPTAILEIAMRFGTLPTIFTTGVSTTFSPVFAGMHVRNEREAFSEALAVGSWLAFVPSACVLLAALMFGPWFLDMFFPELYQDAFVPLLVIVASCALNAAYGLSSPILLVTGCQRLVRTYSAYRLATVVITGIVLGQWLGVTGIAISFLLGVVVFDIGLAKQVRPHLNVSGFLRPQGLQALFRTLKVPA
jgi:O-antigen/teichoic acid export membrane protein